MRKIFIGADSAGFELKEEIRAYLTGKGYDVTDCGTDPYKVEMALKKVIAPQEQASLCHRFVHFGRDICTARSPKCTICPLSHLCAEYKKKA